MTRHCDSVPKLAAAVLAARVFHELHQPIKVMLRDGCAVRHGFKRNAFKDKVQSRLLKSVSLIKAQAALALLGIFCVGVIDYLHIQYYGLSAILLYSVQHAAAHATTLTFFGHAQKVQVNKGELGEIPDKRHSRNSIVFHVSAELDARAGVNERE